MRWRVLRLWGGGDQLDAVFAQELFLAVAQHVGEGLIDIEDAALFMDDEGIQGIGDLAEAILSDAGNRASASPSRGGGNVGKNFVVSHEEIDGNPQSIGQIFESRGAQLAHPSGLNAGDGGLGDPGERRERFLVEALFLTQSFERLSQWHDRLSLIRGGVMKA
jgi:hypothetical protein